MANRNSPNLKQAQIVCKPKSANFAITAIESGCCFTNLGATGNIVGTLPKAAPSLEYRFFVAATHTLTITPRSTDSIRGKGAGASYAYGTIGGLIHLVCIVAGTWEIETNIGPFI